MRAESPNLRDIFDQAIDLASPTDRKAYLDKVCAETPELRSKVEALLQAHDNAGSFLDSPASYGETSGSPNPVLEGPGSIIGPYKLLEQIGEGGMGVVFMAEQTQPVQRKVALKIVKPGMDTKQVIARFEAERQALAMMDHPNIARVLDAGTTAEVASGQGSVVGNLAPGQWPGENSDSSPLPTDHRPLTTASYGRPYFVMELVRGVPLTEFCDQHRLTIRQRLELFINVCQAVQHAHQKGIIHRDLKPTNVLVTLHDTKPVVKVIDFGVAKATGQKLTEKTLFTGLTQMIGTPLYMSPEQAEMSGLDVDTRSDIYSLGVLLYELLTGHTPFDNERLKASPFDEMRRIIREEEPPRPSTRLSTLAQQAISTISEKRSSDPRHLSRLFQGELDWIVMKCLEKDRNRRYETASALAADLEHYLADEPVQACPPSAVYRFRKFARRYRTAIAFGTALISLLLLGIFVSTWQAVRATHAEHQAIQERDAKEQARREAEAVSKFLVAAFRSPDPQRDGRNITIAEVLDRAVKEAREQFADDPRLQANLLEAIGETYVGLGLWSESVSVFETVRDLRKTIPGIDWVQMLEAEENLAKMYACTGRIPEAIKMQEEQLQLIQSKMGPTHRATINAMGNLAETYLGACRFDEAVALQEKTLELKKSQLGPDDPDTLTTSRNLGETYLFAGKFPEGVALLEQTFKREQALLGAGTKKLPGSSQALADAYIRVGRSPEAILLLEPLCDSNRRHLGPHHFDTMRANNSLVEAYRDAGRIEEAAALAEETHKLCQEFVSPSNRLALDALTNLASVYQSQGRTDQALALYQQALANAKSAPGNPQTVEMMTSLGKALYTAGRIEESIPLLTEALQINKAELGRQNINTIESMDDLALADLDAGRLDEAVPLFEETNQFRTNKLGRDNQITITSASNLAEAYIVANRAKEAEPLARECLKTLEKSSPDEWQTHFVRLLLGAAILGQKNEIEAEPLLTSGYQGIHERIDKIADDDRPLVKKAIQQIIQLYQPTNQPEKVALWKERLKDFDNSDGKQKSEKNAAATTASLPLNPEPQP